MPHAGAELLGSSKARSEWALFHIQHICSITITLVANMIFWTFIPCPWLITSLVCPFLCCTLQPDPFPALSLWWRVVPPSPHPCVDISVHTNSSVQPLSYLALYAIMSSLTCPVKLHCSKKQKTQAAGLPKWHNSENTWDNPWQAWSRAQADQEGALQQQHTGFSTQTLSTSS